MGWLSWILMGLLAGLLARFIMPGKAPGGIIITILLGIAGAFVGGWISSHLGWGGIYELDLRGFAIATGGAVLLLVVYGLLRGRRAV
jgi:uncharacterized membrane protein YeaQ/YmgE (transglycosylase-associated protein family)